MEMDSALVQKYFFLSQVVFGVLLAVATLYFFRPGKENSSFKVRESDRKSASQAKLKSQDQDLAHAKYNKKEPLLLTGIQIHGSAHQILGVQPNASRSEILNAYKELMKRYHPDVVGPPGSQAWKDAQAIAAALNKAKEELVKKATT